MDIPIPLSVRDDELRARRAHPRFRRPEAPHRRLPQTSGRCIGVGLAIAIAVGAWLAVQEAGGIESLKSDASSLGSSASAMAARRRSGRRTLDPGSGSAGPRDACSSGYRTRCRRDCGERGPGHGLGSSRRAFRRGGCGLGRNERRAVDRAGELDPLEPTTSAAAQGRAAADTCAGRRFKAPANAPFGAFPSTL